MAGLALRPLTGAVATAHVLQAMAVVVHRRVAAGAHLQEVADVCSHSI
jgi:hypothetical protein